MNKSLTYIVTCVLLLFSSVLKTNGQCAGNSLFKETFGGVIGSPPEGPPLPPRITSYQFDPLGAINDGEYGIRKTTADLSTGLPQFGVWHIGGDHTGNGYMMIVNADAQPGKFYETRVDNLCSGTKLYFSAHLANLMHIDANNLPLDPQVRFEIRSAISGSVLATYTTPPLRRYIQLSWTRYGINFTVPAGETSVVLVMYNNQPGGNGNDLALDDIEFTLCGPNWNPKVIGGYPNSGEVCLGSFITLNTNATGGSFQNPDYQWQYSVNNVWIDIPGAKSLLYQIPNVQPADAGRYRLLIAETGNINAVNCRSVSPVIEMFVFAPVNPVLITGTTLMCERDTIRLTTNVIANDYAWIDPQGNVVGTVNPLVLPANSPAQSGTYNLNLVTPGGCRSSGSINVQVDQNPLQRGIPANALLCNSETLTVNAAVPPAVSFLWNDGTISPQRTFSNAGNYVLLSSDGKCKRTDSLVITKFNNPVVQLRNDTTICRTDSVLIDATHNQSQRYLWNTGSTASSIKVVTAGFYSVTATNACGTATGSVNIFVDECAYDVFVPNAFTPNGDQLNEILRAHSFFPIRDFEFTIYTRWGKQIFLSNEISKGWDGLLNGAQSPPGTYIWKVKYRQADKFIIKKGSFLLIR